MVAKIKGMLFVALFVVLLATSVCKTIKKIDEPYSGYGYEMEQQGKTYNIMKGVWE